MKQIRRGTQTCGFSILLFAFLQSAFARTAEASPQLNPSCPLDFFTNVASRLLSSQLNVNLNHIQIYPTNQYTPAVHRLLQLTANVLDCTTTNYYSSVFRPLFWKTNEECSDVWQTNIYITGYQYVHEPLPSNNPPILSIPVDANDASLPFGLSGITNNIYGIPWVIGVKKGLPNFNAFELDNSFFIERQLQFTRNSAALASPGQLFPYGRTYATNQMYIMGVSNMLAIDDWNSYASNYNNQVTIGVYDSLSFSMTNSAGFSILNLFSTNVTFTISLWPGGLFVIPFGTNMSVEQNLSFAGSPASSSGTYVYYDGPAAVSFGGFTYQAPCFVPESLDTSNFLDSGTLPLPNFGLVTTNHLQAYILDTDQKGNIHILDYVQFGAMNSSLNINAAVQDSNDTGFWSTNVYGASTTPWGVLNQYIASSIGGTVPAEDADGGGPGGAWTTTPVPGLPNNIGSGPAAQQAFFSAFFSPGDAATYNGEYVTNLQLSVLAPFTPMREIAQRFIFQANDPLVHYLVSDLNDINDDTSNRIDISMASTNGIRTIGLLSDRYMPWGNLPWGATPGFGYSYFTALLPEVYDGVQVDENPYNLAYKDPLVWTPDEWDFPTNETLNASWLGQVHRGTPWQTIYLKSTNILDLQSPSPGSGLSTWALWTGDTNPNDAASMAPVHDWQIASLLASLFNTNSESSLFSPNDPNPNDWENLLNGMTVLTNDLDSYILEYAGQEFTHMTISSNSSQAGEIADAIDTIRSSLPRQLFLTPGSIFAVPRLSDDSPYLNVDALEVQLGISDEAYEAIPDQILPLLRIDSIGSMTTANGQVIIQFTGDDNHVYAVQVSPNLLNWTTISTNCPVNGIFSITNAATANPQFYRTALLY
jgi:hypothetical protein